MEQWLPKPVDGEAIGFGNHTSITDLAPRQSCCAAMVAETGCFSVTMATTFWILVVQLNVSNIFDPIMLNRRSYFPRFIVNLVNIYNEICNSLSFMFKKWKNSLKKKTDFLFLAQQKQMK